LKLSHLRYQISLAFYFNLGLSQNYKNGVGPPVLRGSFGAIILGKIGSGGGIKSDVLNG
jgi:hypothetical protein